MRRRKRSTQPDRLVSSSLAFAYWQFARTFNGPKRAFWRRMTVTGAALGSLALATEPAYRELRFKPKHLVEGVAIAGGLYGMFSVGDRMARKIMPGGAEQIGDIYELRNIEPAAMIIARLAAIIGPAEELYWRGFVQKRLGAGRSRLGAVGLGVSTYAGAHVITRNPTLLGAAAVAGAYWGSLYEAGVAMESLIVSHVLWDAVIFLLRPTSASRRAMSRSSSTLSEPAGAGVV
jgi:membrane protease YdiL (CAAX protease family)